MNVNIVVLAFFFSLTVPAIASAQEATVLSPDRQLKVAVSVTDGKQNYAVTYNGKIMLEASPPGFKTKEIEKSVLLLYKF